MCPVLLVLQHFPQPPTLSERAHTCAHKHTEWKAGWNSPQCVQHTRLSAVRSWVRCLSFLKGLQPSQIFDNAPVLLFQSVKQMLKQQ